MGKNQTPSNLVSLKTILDWLETLTPILKSFLQDQQKNHPSQQFQRLAQITYHHFQQCIFSLNKHSPGQERAIATHKLIDLQLARKSSEEISCRKRCTTCCYFPKQITDDELDLLALLIKSGTSIDWQLLEQQSLMIENEQFQALPPRPATRCLFLGEDALCQIYDHRPMVCRNLRVTSPSEECAKPYGKVMRSRNLSPEIVISAALNSPGNGLGSMQLKLRKKFLTPSMTVS